MLLFADTWPLTFCVQMNILTVVSNHSTVRPQRVIFSIDSPLSTGWLVSVVSGLLASTPSMWAPFVKLSYVSSLEQVKHRPPLTMAPPSFAFSSPWRFQLGQVVWKFRCLPILSRSWWLMVDWQQVKSPSGQVPFLFLLLVVLDLAGALPLRLRKETGFVQNLADLH